MIDTFLSEGQEEIATLNNRLIDIEQRPDDEEAMEELFRAAHTLKGNSGAMGFSEMERLAHAAEDVLDEIRQDSLTVSSEVMDVLFDAVDGLEKMLDEVRNHGHPKTSAENTIDNLHSFLDHDVGGCTDDDGNSEDLDELFSDAPSLDDTPDTDALTDEDVEAAFAKSRENNLKQDSTAEADVGCSAGSEVFSDIQDEIDDEPRDFDEIKAEMDEMDFDWNGESSEDSDLSYQDLVGGNFGDSEADRGDIDESDIVNTGPVWDDLDDEVSDVLDIDGTTEKPDFDATSDDLSDSATRPSSESSSDSSHSTRVDVSDLDDLYSQVQELIMNRIRIQDSLNRVDQSSPESLDQPISELENLDIISSQIRDTVMELRLMPLENATRRLPRIVRDIAREQEKEVDFEIDGEDVELDRSILDNLGDPLMHLVRNAVDHGVEKPSVRVEKGKPETGTVTVSATRERDSVVIIVEDDGAGIDANRLRSEAVSEDVISESQASSMTDDQVYDLIFHPGFSTANEVTDVSGRGVGMDVVHESIKSVDGSVDVSATPDEGTTVTIRLPISLSIIQALFVVVGGEKVAIPIKNINEVSYLDEIEMVEGERVHIHDEKTYPVVQLDDALGLESRDVAENQQRMIRLDDDVRQIAVVCDGVIKQEEVVVEPYDGILRHVVGVSGAAILGTGRVVNILDVSTI